jgi:hypothetical protein
LTLMPAKLPTNPPAPIPDKPAEDSFDPFRPEMPQIPGVSQAARDSRQGLRGVHLERLWQIGTIAVVVVLAGASVSWWIKNKPRTANKSPASEPELAEPAAPVPPLSDSIAPVREGPTVVAVADELSKPWAAKKFTFVRSLTQEKIDAMAIRLPDGGLWAFALQSPYARCELEFVTDLGRIASQFGYHASHPMVVSPCDSTVYDPLKVGPLGGDTWARGEIVQGSALRPPISIEVQVRGRSIIADRME